jgi:hypothetical protein
MFLIMLYLQSPHKKLYNRRAAAKEIYGLDASPDWSSFVSFSFMRGASGKRSDSHLWQLSLTW